MNNEGNPLNVHLDVTVEGGDPQSLDFTINPEVGIVPENVVEEGADAVGDISIKSALDIIARAEAGEATTEEINDKIKDLQELQRPSMGFSDPDGKIAGALAKLIAVRGE